MKIVTITLVALASMLSIAPTVLAETISYKFSYSVPYEKKGFNSKPKDGELERAIGLANEEIWKIHQRNLSADKLKRYESPDVREKIKSRLDEIVSIKGSPQIKVDTKAMVIQVGGRGLVNTTLLETIGSDGTRSDRSFSDLVIGFMVLPRLQKSATTFDVEREATEGASSKTMQEAAMRLQAEGDSSNVSANAVVGEKNAVEITARSSGQSTRISQDAEYIIGDVRQVTNGLNSFFTGAGFQANNYVDIAAYCGGPSSDVVMEAIVDRSSGDLPGNLRKGVFDATTDSGCLGGQYFILGTIDVDSISMVQGKYEASAIVNVEIFDLTRRIPRSLATIKSIREGGEGRTQDIAVSNAIDNATTRSGAEIQAAFINSIE